MHTATFYSFKGGVGRTLALVNVAAELASRGKRVLIVDFDLEAPGIPTFAPFAPARGQPGIVEYVLEYLRTNIAPSVEDYLFPARDAFGSGKVWVMPAGRQNDDYAVKLSQVDWNRLYEDREGFLMFEDLRNQWRDLLRPDYVLIDSRTGHTDVGGICTRHLADSVIAMFFPNEQNIGGLATVANAIRRERDSPRERLIELHFVLSNVPELDDEEGILEAQLASAQRELLFTSHPAVLHHYPSLRLLGQSIFTLERRKTRLAAEYRELADAVVRDNIEATEGAIAFLDWTLDEDPGLSGWALDSEVEPKLERIEKAHQNNGEVLAKLGLLRERTGDVETALRLYSSALDRGHQTGRVFRRRAQLWRMEGNKKAAVQDLRSVLGGKETAIVDLVAAFRMLGDLAPEHSDEYVATGAHFPLPADARIQVAWHLLGSRSSLAAATEVASSVLSLGDASQAARERAEKLVVLGLIGQGRFSEAKALMAQGALDVDTEISVEGAFNYAMADWAEAGARDVTLFARVLELATTDGYEGPNWFQCLAIAADAVGEKSRALQLLARARQALRRYSRRNFSAWRYLEVGRDEFLSDLDDIESMVEGSEMTPPFFVRQN